MAAKKKADAKPKASTPKAKPKEIDPAVKSQINQLNVLIKRHEADIDRLKAEIDELQK